MTNEQLALRVRAGDDVAASMAALIDQVRPFAYQQAARYKGLTELEDLQQEAILALYAAVDHYDSERGSFLSVAALWIRKQLQQYVDQNSGYRLPYGRIAKVRKFRKAYAEYQERTGREPQEGDLAAILHVTTEQIREIEMDSYMSSTARLDAPLSDDPEGGTLGDLAADPEGLEDSFVAAADQEELAALLWPLVDDLPGKQPEVIRGIYQRTSSAPQIAAELGIGEQEAVNLHKKALRALRKPERSNRLRPYLPEAEQIYMDAMKGNGVGIWKRTETSSTERAAIKAYERTGGKHGQEDTE